MRDSNDMRAAVTEYTRNYIRERRRAKWTFERIATELGVSPAYVQHINSPDKHPKLRVGLDMEHTLAELLHGGSVDSLRKAAQHIYGGGRVIVEVDGQPAEITTAERSGSPSSTPPHLPGSAAGAGTSQRRIKRGTQR